MRTKVNRNEAMLVGAFAIGTAMITRRLLGLAAFQDDSLTSWCTALLGGALVGLGVARLMNRKRT